MRFSSLLIAKTSSFPASSVYFTNFFLISNHPVTLSGYITVFFFSFWLHFDVHQSSRSTPSHRSFFLYFQRFKTKEKIEGFSFLFPCCFISGWFFLLLICISLCWCYFYISMSRVGYNMQQCLEQQLLDPPLLFCRWSKR